MPRKVAQQMRHRTSHNLPHEQIVIFIMSLFAAQDLSFCNDKNVILLSFVNVKELVCILNELFLPIYFTI